METLDNSDGENRMEKQEVRNRKQEGSIRKQDEVASQRSISCFQPRSRSRTCRTRPNQMEVSSLTASSLATSGNRTRGVARPYIFEGEGEATNNQDTPDIEIIRDDSNEDTEVEVIEVIQSTNPETVNEIVKPKTDKAVLERHVRELEWSLAARTTSHCDLVASLTSALECPVCRLVPRSAPVPVCANGHICCAPCSRASESCPVCRCLTTKYDCTPSVQGRET